MKAVCTCLHLYNSYTCKLARTYKHQHINAHHVLEAVSFFPADGFYRVIKNKLGGLFHCYLLLDTFNLLPNAKISSYDYLVVGGDRQD